MVGELLRHVPIHVFKVGGTDFTLFLAIRLQAYFQLNIKIVCLAARQVGLAMLATIKASLGSLDKVKRVIKVLGMVNCVSSFERHPYVMNGCSELFAAVWGKEMGIGVRSAVGMGSLPDNIPVEIEGLYELH